MVKSLNEHIWSLVERLYIHVYNPNMFIQLLNDNGIKYQATSYSGRFDLDKPVPESVSYPKGYEFMKSENCRIIDAMKDVPISDQLNILSKIIFDDAIIKSNKDDWNYLQEYVKNWYPSIIQYLKDAKVEFNYEKETLEYHPICFISYSWDSEEHKNWVRSLAEKLYTNGVCTILDQWHLKKGDDLPHFMEKSIDCSDYVILILTPQYASKADNRKGGVGYENTIITGYLYNMHNEDTNVEFLPILREGNLVNSAPKYLKTKVHIPFTDSDSFDDSFDELLRRIYNKPRYSPPPLGSNPFSKVSSSTISNSPYDIEKSN